MCIRDRIYRCIKGLVSNKLGRSLLEYREHTLRRLSDIEEIHFCILHDNYVLVPTTTVSNFRADATEGQHRSILFRNVF